jgi:hypothetical protein
MADFDRPAKAKALLESPLFIEAFSTVEKAIHDKWAETPTSRHEELHELRLMLSALKNVRKSVEAVAAEGKTQLHREKQPTFLGDLYDRTVERIRR